MKIHAYQCSECKDTVFSRARHDFRYCSCENLFCDGGQEDYFRVGATKNYHLIKHIELELEITKEELYKDWNKAEDKYGIIKES